MSLDVTIREHDHRFVAMVNDKGRNWKVSANADAPDRVFVTRGALFIETRYSRRSNKIELVAKGNRAEIFAQKIFFATAEEVLRAAIVYYAQWLRETDNGNDREIASLQRWGHGKPIGAVFNSIGFRSNPSRKGKKHWHDWKPIPGEMGWYRCSSLGCYGKRVGKHILEKDPTKTVMLAAGQRTKTKHHAYAPDVVLGKRLSAHGDTYNQPEGFFGHLRGNPRKPGKFSRHVLQAILVPADRPDVMGSKAKAKIVAMRHGLKGKKLLKVVRSKNFFDFRLVDPKKVRPKSYVSFKVPKGGVVHRKALLKAAPKKASARAKKPFQVESARGSRRFATKKQAIAYARSLHTSSRVAGPNGPLAMFSGKKRRNPTDKLQVFRLRSASADLPPQNDPEWREIRRSTKEMVEKKFAHASDADLRKMISKINDAVPKYSNKELGAVLVYLEAIENLLRRRSS